MTRRLTKVVCVTCLALASTRLCADGVGVSAAYSPAAGGYKYYLTLCNSTAAALGAYVWELHVNIVLPAAVEHPLLWEYITVTGGSVDWATALGQDPSGNWAQGVPPGGTLSGFSFTAPSLAASLWYRAFTYDGGQTGTYTGYAYPELVPEPSALLALAGGLGTLGLPMLRRRRKA